MNAKYLTVAELQTEYGLTDNVSGREVTEKDYEYFIKRASSKVNTITNNYIPKQIASNKYLLANDGKLTINKSEYENGALGEEQLKLGALKESLGRLVKFGIDTGFDFITGSFSQSLGGVSQSEQIDFETSYMRLEKEIRELLAIYDFDGSKTSPTTYDSFSFGVSDKNIANYAALHSEKINADMRPLTLLGLRTLLTGGYITNAKMVDPESPKKGIYVDVAAELKKELESGELGSALVKAFLKTDLTNWKKGATFLETAMIKDKAVTKAKLSDDVSLLHNDLVSRASDNITKITDNTAKITTLTDDVKELEKEVDNLDNKIDNVKPTMGANKIATLAKQATDKLRHQIGLNPTKAFSNFESLGLSTDSIINDYDANSKTSEYGIFNAIIAKAIELKIPRFVVQGRLDDTNNALFSVFFKSIFNKAGGDFALTPTYNDKALITFIINNNILNWHSQDPNKNFTKPYNFFVTSKDHNTGNWEIAITEFKNSTSTRFDSYHEYIDDEELFINSNGEIGSLREWRGAENSGLRHSGFLGVWNYDSGLSTPLKTLGVDSDELTSLQTYQSGKKWRFDFTFPKTLAGGWFEIDLFITLTISGRRHHVSLRDARSSYCQMGQYGSSLTNNVWTSNGISATGRILDYVYLDPETHLNLRFRNNGTKVQVGWNFEKFPKDADTRITAYKMSGSATLRKNDRNQKVIDKTLSLEIEPHSSADTATIDKAFITFKKVVSA